MSEADDDRSPRTHSRRRVLKGVGVAAGAAAVGSGHALSRRSPAMPRTLDAWPPDVGAGVVVAGTRYDTWAAWARRAFDDNTGISLQDYDALAWEPTLSWDGRRRPPGLLETLYERATGLFTEPTVRDEPTGSFDSVVTTTDMLRLALGDGLLHPLPADDVPAFDRTFDAVDGLSVHRSGGDVFAVPVEAQPAPLVYNADYFDAPPDSWSALWEADEGEVLVDTDVVYEHPTVAALYAGEDPRDPDLDAVEAALREQRPLLVDDHGGRDSPPSVERFANEEAIVGSLSLPAIYEARFEREVPLEYAIPSEGAPLGCHFAVVPTASRRPLAGLRYVDWLTRPEVAAKRWELERAVPTVPVGEQVTPEVRAFLDWASDGEFHLKPHLFGTDTTDEYRRLIHRVVEDRDV